jgi:TolB-like protein/Flp pilus assembly protein TadD
MNLSEDKANAYFADGIQEEILTRLAKIADLKVISRTSTQQYQSKPGNLSEIAQQLGVANILEGSVQKVGDQVRVNVQLINAKTDSHLWADIYDRKLTDIFAVESEIAKAIAESLQVKLTGSEQQALAAKPTNNLEAYDAYLRGLAFESRSYFSADNNRKAVGFYERAVQLDPSFALAWGRLSRADSWMYFNSAEDEAGAARRDAAEQALKTVQKLQPNAPETLLAEGVYQYRVLRDYELAKTTFGRARKVLPASSEVLRILAAITRRQGHWDECIAYGNQALVLNPRDIESIIDLALTHCVLRQFPAALKMYDRALDITPNDPDLIGAKSNILQAQGDWEQAGKLLANVNADTPSRFAFERKIRQLFGERHYDEVIRLLQTRLTHEMTASDRSWDQVSLAFAQQLAGDSTGARASAEQARDTMETLCKKDPDSPRFAETLSQAYAALGQKDAALKEAERAVTLLPSARDPVSGPGYEENLANVQVHAGENDRAIAILQHLLTVPYGWIPITPAQLRFDPTWDPLRSDPRFEKLCSQKDQ